MKTIASVITNGLFLLILIFAVSCSNRVVYHSSWYRNEDERKETVKQFRADKKSQILYKIANDSSVLIVDFLVNDKLIQEKILKFGLTVWIDTLNSKKEKIGIKYPLGNSGQFGRDSDFRELQHMPTHYGNKHYPESISQGIEIINNTNGINIKYLNKINSNTVNVRINFDEFEMMHYCLKIQYSEIDVKLSQLSKTPFSIGFITGKADFQQQHFRGQMPIQTEDNLNQTPPFNKAGFQMPDRNEMEALQNSTVFWVKNVTLDINK